MPLSIVFDLDGTLIDSLPMLTSVANKALARAGLAPLAGSAVRAMVGDGARVLLTRAFAARGAAFGEPAFEAFMADYREEAAAGSPPFPGVPEALAALMPRRMAICTNKPQAAAEAEIEALGLARFCPVLVGGDALPWRKPDPRHAQACLDRLGGGRAVMIGDHANDLSVAAALGWPGIFCAWGYGDLTAPLTARKPADLPGLIAALEA